MTQPTPFRQILGEHIAAFGCQPEPRAPVEAPPWRDLTRAWLEAQWIVERPPATAVPLCLRALGLSSRCGVQQIKRAFRRQALQLHPDRGGSQQAFVELCHAYQDALRLA